eukprot:COSAG02_NODE_817_length_16825_cov_49.127646_10_plen_156_part_00
MPEPVRSMNSELRLSNDPTYTMRPQLLPPLREEVRCGCSNLELEEAVAYKLEDGIEKHDVDMLSVAIAEAITMKLDLPVLVRAQRTLSVLQEAGDVLKALQTAMLTPRGSSKVTRLVSALTMAKSRGFGGNTENALPEVTEAKKMLAMAQRELRS